MVFEVRLLRLGLLNFRVGFKCSGGVCRAGMVFVFESTSMF